MTYLKIFYWRVVGWWYDHRPVRCVECGRWVQSRQARREQATTGQVYVFCRRCWMIYFRPFSRSRNGG